MASESRADSSPLPAQTQGSLTPLSTNSTEGTDAALIPASRCITQKASVLQGAATQTVRSEQHCGSRGLHQVSSRGAPIHPVLFGLWAMPLSHSHSHPHPQAHGDTRPVAALEGAAAVQEEAFWTRPLGTWGTGGQGACQLLHWYAGRDKQKELEVLMHDQDYDLIGITKAWWAQPHDWNINIGGFSLFWKDRQRIKEECVALYIKDADICSALQGEPGCCATTQLQSTWKGLCRSHGQAQPKPGCSGDGDLPA